MFHCTRELAACDIVMYFTGVDGHRFGEVCGASQTGRHLVAPLFVAAALMVVGSGAKFVIRKRGEKVGTADERVERLQREEEE